MAKTLTGQAFSAFGVVCVGFYISEEKMKNTEIQYAEKGKYINHIGVEITYTNYTYCIFTA